MRPRGSRKPAVMAARCARAYSLDRARAACGPYGNCGGPQALIAAFRKEKREALKVADGVAVKKSKKAAPKKAPKKRPTPPAEEPAAKKTKASKETGARFR
jgi:hypothetical protein